jgi:hypothetical protein
MLLRIRSGSVFPRGRRLAVAAGFAAAATIVTACSTNNVLDLRPDVDLGVETAAVSVRPVGADVTPVDVTDQSYPATADPSVAQDDPSAGEPYDVGYVAPNDPTNDPYADQNFNEPYSEPYVQGPPPMPADEVACRQQLKRLDVAYEELDPINDGGVCRIDHPIRLKSIGSVKMQPAATLRCEMALTVARWTRKELVPSARSRYLSGVKTIHQASSYSCRKIARSRTMSEHAKGNALDISRIELNSGRDIEIEKQGIFAFRSRSLLNNVRSDACEYFSTVLGPGYNYDHRNHFHFDIKPRRRVSCH